MCCVRFFLNLQLVCCFFCLIQFDRINNGGLIMCDVRREGGANDYGNQTKSNETLKLNNDIHIKISVSITLKCTFDGWQLEKFAAFSCEHTTNEGSLVLVLVSFFLRRG